MMNTSTDVLTNERKTYYETEGINKLVSINKYIFGVVYLILSGRAIYLYMYHESSISQNIRLFILICLLILPFVSSYILGIIIYICYKIYGLFPSNVYLNETANVPTNMEVLDLEISDNFLCPDDYEFNPYTKSCISIDNNFGIFGILDGDIFKHGSGSGSGSGSGNDAKCLINNEMVGGNCAWECQYGFAFDTRTNTCKPLTCPTGQQISGNSCVPDSNSSIGTTGCGSGYNLINNTHMCVMCPDNQNWDPTNKICK